MLTRETEALFVEALVIELHRLTTLYQARVEHYHAHSLSVGDNVQIVGTWVAVGSILGSPLPIIGNAIGGAGGLLAGMLTVKGLEFSHHRDDRRHANAQAVIDFLSGDKDAILYETAQHVIAARRDLLAKLVYPARDLPAITQFLAVNIMAAIKFEHFKRVRSAHLVPGLPSNQLALNDKVQLIVEGVREKRSHQHVHHTLHFREGPADIAILAEPSQEVATPRTMFSRLFHVSATVVPKGYVEKSPGLEGSPQALTSR